MESTVATENTGPGKGEKQDGRSTRRAQRVFSVVGSQQGSAHMERPKDEACEKLGKILTGLMNSMGFDKDSHEKWREAFYTLGRIEGKLEMRCSQ